MPGFQGGSKTISTLTSLTSGSAAKLAFDLGLDHV